MKLQKLVEKTLLKVGKIRKIDGEDNVCILGGPRIQVAQPTEGSTAEFPGDD